MVENTAIAQLTTDNVISAYCYASKFGACRLLEAAECLIRSQFGCLVNELEWLELSDIEFFVETNEEHTEIELLRVLLKWLHFNPRCVNVLKFIRPSLLIPRELENLEIPTKAQFQMDRIVERVATYHKNIFNQPLLTQEPCRTTKPVYAQIDGVQCSGPIKLPHRIVNRHIRSAMSELNMSSEHKNYRDPSHCVVQVNGFIFCLGGVRKFGIGASAKVLRYRICQVTYLTLF